MDPVSGIAGVLGMIDIVLKLVSELSRLKENVQLADEEVDAARRHTVLLREEINRLELGRPSLDNGCSGDPQDIPASDSSFLRAISLGRELLVEIEEGFPACSRKPRSSEKLIFREKWKYAVKDKRKLEKLMARLHHTQSTLHGIVLLEQLRISRLTFNMIRRQQFTMNRTENVEFIGIVNDSEALTGSGEDSTRTPGKIQTEPTDTHPSGTRLNGPTPMITRPNSMLPWTVGFNRWGVSGQFTVLPRESPATTTYRAAIQLKLLRRMFSVQLQTSRSKRRLYFNPTFSVRNIAPNESKIARACRKDDFEAAYYLLTNGLAHGNDMTASGLPVLEYAIQNGSARLVSLLLDNGADPNQPYGEHNMSPLQACFLRRKLDLATILISKGANINYVDNDGFSVLSYLWIVDKRPEQATEFMQLCLANGFSEVNSCDNRGWTGLHSAAGFGNVQDIEMFLSLGASLELRAEWYGWCAIFFAAVHDNVETFETIVRHSGPNVYGLLDGDGWSLLHCCIYFGAYRVMRLLLLRGADVNQKSLPSPLPEDPELLYRVLSPLDIASYVGPSAHMMFLETLSATCREKDLRDENNKRVPPHSRHYGPGSIARTLPPTAQAAEYTHEIGGPSQSKYDPHEAQKQVYAWALMYWASYHDSPKVKKLLLMTGTDPTHLELAGRRRGLGIEPLFFECP